MKRVVGWWRGKEPEVQALGEERGNSLVQASLPLASDSELWLPSWEKAPYLSHPVCSPTKTAGQATERERKRLTFLTGRFGSGSISAIAVFPWSS